MVFQEKEDKSLESAYNESELAIRRQDMILKMINEFGYHVGMNEVGSLREYLSAMERLAMELSVIECANWEEKEEERELINPKTKLPEKVKVRFWKKPDDIKYIENWIQRMRARIDELNTKSEPETLSKRVFEITEDLKFLELFLRRKKQYHGMGIKKEEVVDDEQRLDTAFGL